MEFNIDSSNYTNPTITSSLSDSKELTNTLRIFFNTHSFSSEFSSLILPFNLILMEMIGILKKCIYYYFDTCINRYANEQLERHPTVKYIVRETVSIKC